MKKLILLFSLLSSTFLFAGTESGGGGGVVFNSSKPVLIDFYQMNNFSLNDYEKTNTDNAFDLAKEILDLWQNLPLDNMSLLVKSSLNGPVKWKLTDRPLKAFDHHRPMNLSDRERIETAAYYSMDNRVYQVNIFRPIWEQMDIKNQTGLIIHESLRHVQLGIKTHFNEETLQQATVIYMTCKPSARLNFYLKFILQNDTKMAEKIYGSFDQILSQSCQRI